MHSLLDDYSIPEGSPAAGTCESPKLHTREGVSPTVEVAIIHHVRCALGGHGVIRRKLRLGKRRITKSLSLPAASLG